MAEVTKRVRNKNFTADEEELLISLVENRKTVIENKETNAVTWKQKEAEWKKIAEIFNSETSSGRDVDALKNKYKLIKKQVRKKSAQVRASLYKTGGGPADAPALNTTEEKVKNLIVLSVDGMDSEFDCDILPIHESTQFNTQSSLDTEGADVMPTAEVMSIPVVTQDAVRDWSSWTPANLQSPIHPALSTEDQCSTPNVQGSQGQKTFRGKTKSGRLSSKEARVALKSKEELIELQKELIKKEIKEREEKTELIKLKKELVSYQILKIKKELDM